MSRPRPVIDLAYICCRCVEDGDCLLWDRSQDEKGIPKLTIRADDGRSKTIQPRRLVWEKVKGQIPDGLVVTTKCRNKLCLNPAHLELIHKAEVIRRMSKNPDVKARRVVAGLATRHKRAKLDMEKARYARTSSEPHAVVAKELGVGITTISQVRRGLRWKESNPFAGLGAR